MPDPTNLDPAVRQAIHFGTLTPEQQAALRRTRPAVPRSVERAAAERLKLFSPTHPWALYAGQPQPPLGPALGEGYAVGSFALHVGQAYAFQPGRAYPGLEKQVNGQQVPCPGSTTGARSPVYCRVAAAEDGRMGTGLPGVWFSAWLLRLWAPVASLVLADLFPGTLPFQQTNPAPDEPQIDVPE